MGVEIGARVLDRMLYFASTLACAASLARAEPRAFRVGSGSVEANVLAQRPARWTRRPAVDVRRFDGVHEAPIISCVPLGDGAPGFGVGGTGEGGHVRKGQLSRHGVLGLGTSTFSKLAGG